MAGLYVHIPFCRHKCAYCDFYSGPLRGFAPQEYAAALSRELEARTLAPEYQTVYIGGGTPSTMPPQLLAPFFALSAGERTIEVNPEVVSPRAADLWLSAGSLTQSSRPLGADTLLLRPLRRFIRSAAPDFQTSPSTSSMGSPARRSGHGANPLKASSNSPPSIFRPTP